MLFHYCVVFMYSWFLRSDEIFLKDELDGLLLSWFENQQHKVTVVAYNRLFQTVIFLRLTSIGLRGPTIRKFKIEKKKKILKIIIVEITTCDECDTLFGWMRLSVDERRSQLLYYSSQPTKYTLVNDVSLLAANRLFTSLYRSKARWFMEHIKPIAIDSIFLERFRIVSQGASRYSSIHIKQHWRAILE